MESQVDYQWILRLASVAELIRTTPGPEPSIVDLELRLEGEETVIVSVSTVPQVDVLVLFGPYVFENLAERDLGPLLLALANHRYSEVTVGKRTHLTTTGSPAFEAFSRRSRPN